ncbi:MAG: gamma-glutamylcyclotransferase [Candidatus Heimdallarchaeota archaeon]|nr:MAG: gamma-glutamylcyclotransferase [Candidatus Heimdallarchaeota archaeon]
MIDNQNCDRLFTYGTLQSGQSRNFLLSGLEFKKAILPGYRKVTPPELGFPFIVQDKGSNVTGEIYFQLTQAHWTEIDLIEGEGSLYHRILVEVKTIPNGMQFSTFTYYPSRSLIEQYSEK